ncbi:MAG: hypothetical protein LBK25_00600 [Treponema sp.]|nr:hypothetical protein [Treponema sp.]
MVVHPAGVLERLDLTRRAGRIGGWRKTPKGSGDRGAHHKGVCVPSSVSENRAPLQTLHRLRLL